jgi:4-hydroxy-tetrahydrodipicolinate synthase
VTPYYNKATQKGLVEHYTQVAASVDLPIIMYNVPSRTGCNILPETAVRLARDVENIVGIKEATGNISQVAKLMSLAEGCIDLYSGNDDQIVPIMSLGGKGVISVLSNVAPRQAHDIVASYLAGDVEKSCRMQLEAIELIDALFVEVNPIPVKHALNLMGKNVGPLRMPLSPMEEKNLEVLKRAMKNYGLL